MNPVSKMIIINDKLTMQNLTYFYLGLQITLFVWCIIQYIFPLVRRWVQLNRINKELLKKHGDKRTLTEIGEHTVFDLFRKVPWLTDYYQKFRTIWNDAKVPGRDRAELPIRLSDFLKPRSVVDKAANQRMAEALPGIFVAIGIFGTFLGLYLGLRGINIEQHENLKQAVQQLVGGLSLAFVTSLVGIFCSTFFSPFHRYLVRRVEKSFLDLDELLSKLYPYYSNERYARKAIEIQGDLKQGMQTLATDVATSIGKVIEPAMGHAISENLVPIMEKIQGSLADHLENTQQKHSETMESVLKEYVECMNASFQGQFSDLNQIILETTQVQSGIKEQLLDFTKQLQEQFQVHTDLLEKTGRAGSILSDSLDSLEKISVELKSAADDITSAASLLEKSASKALEGQQELRETMDIQIQAMSTTRVELEKSWEGIIENSNSAVALIKEVIRQLGEGVGEQLTRALSLFDSKLAEVVERFSGTLFEAKQTIDELPSAMARFNDIVENLGKDISDQRSLIEELKKVSQESIKPSIDSAAELIQDLTGPVSELLSFTEKMGNSLREVVEVLAKDGHLQPSIVKLTESLAEVHGVLTGDYQNIPLALTSINENIQVLKESLAITTAGGDGDLEELKEQFKNIADINLNLSKNVGLLVSSLGKISSRLDDDTVTDEMENKIGEVVKSNLNLSNNIGVFLEELKKLSAAVDSVEKKDGFIRRIIGR